MWRQIKLEETETAKEPQSSTLAAPSNMSNMIAAKIIGQVKTKKHKELQLSNG